MRTNQRRVLRSLTQIRTEIYSLVFRAYTGVNPRLNGFWCITNHKKEKYLTRRHPGMKIKQAKKLQNL